MITKLQLTILQAIKGSVLDISLLFGVISYVLAFDGNSPDPTIIFVLYEAFIATLGIDS